MKVRNRKQGEVTLEITLDMEQWVILHALIGSTPHPWLSTDLYEGIRRAVWPETAKERPGA